MGKEGKKIHLIHSIVLKVVWCVVFAIALTWLLQYFMFIPLAKNNTSENMGNYMYDLAVSYGTNLERNVALRGAEEELSKEVLGELFDGVKIKGSDSSYLYITDGQGTMLYHPTEEKIGQPVENEVVQGLVSRLQAGEIAQPALTTYNFNGVTKYASYYVGGDGSFILVVTADKSEMFSTVTTMRIRGVLSGLFSLVVCGLIGFVLAKLVVKPIKKVTESVLKLADWDFTETENEKKLNRRKDETGQISRVVSKLREGLSGIAKDINEQTVMLFDAADSLNTSTGKTSEAVEQVERAVSEIADGANSQAEETQKATENVILIGNMVEEAGRQVEKLGANASVMQRAGKEADNTLKQLDETNSKTREAIERIYQQTHTTNESALKIREATTMITSIAEETNLLSLNASIEAARAGEQGRGFAVVAGQIQKLAEQSNESARQIEEIIDSLIHDSEEAVATMDSVREIIAEQSENVEKTGAGFAEVKKGIDSSLESVQAITASINKMDEARVNVVDVVQNLTAIAEENAASTEETSASATEVTATIQNMSDQAEQLKGVATGLDNSMKIFKF